MRFVFLLALVFIPSVVLAHGAGKYTCDERIANMKGMLMVHEGTLELKRFKSSNFVFDNGDIFFCPEGHSRLVGAKSEGYPKCGVNKDVFPSYASLTPLKHKDLGLPRPIRFYHFIRECGSVYVGF